MTVYFIAFSSFQSTKYIIQITIKKYFILKELNNILAQIILYQEMMFYLDSKGVMG